MIFEAVISSVVGACLCGLLGFYVSRLGLSTLAFTVAHAALAGAATALMLGLDMTYLAMLFSMVTAVMLGLLYSRLPHAMDSVCMVLFSFFNAVALLAIYYSNAVVLATASVSAVLWGSVLAVTKEKLIVLVGIATIFTLYLVAYRKHMDAILFDKRIAEAEGMNVTFHITALLVLASLSLSMMLRIVGGFLVFTLLYVPTALTTSLQLSVRGQYVAIPAFATLSALAGLGVSFALDLPVGVSITLSTVVTASVVRVAAFLAEKALLSGEGTEGSEPMR